MNAKTFFQILAAVLCIMLFLWMVQSCKTPKVATEEKAMSKSEPFAAAMIAWPILPLHPFKRSR